MAAFLDNCRFVATAGGTTDWTYSSAVTGYQSPSAAGVVNSTVYEYFAISSSGTEWEIGRGAYNTGTGVLARTTVLYNSSGTGSATGQSGAGSKINFAAAPQVAVVAIKESLISIEEANSFSTTQQDQARSNINANRLISTTTSALGADVNLGTINTYFDGPSVAQGSTGTWLVTGTVTLIDTTLGAGFDVKLWDGTTVIASASVGTAGANFKISVTLSGVISSPAGNLRMTVRNTSSTAGKILFNNSGNSKDSSITALRIA